MSTAIDASYPFDSSPILNEAAWRAMAQWWRGSGVLSGAKVEPFSGMVLSVATGAFWVNGAYGGITSTKTVTIGANSSGNPRIDVVVARCDTVANEVVLDVLVGTPASSPTAPTLTQTSATYEVALAQVAVAAGATSIDADDITDRRDTYEVPRTDPNPVRNASMAIAQRGTSITVGAAVVFTLDGWKAFRTGSVTGMTVSQQSTGGLAAGGYCLRAARDSGSSGTATMFVQQSLSSAASKRFAGQQACLSFWARKGADYSASLNALLATIYSGTGTDEPLSAGLTGQASTSATVTLSNTWQLFTVLANIPATASQLAVDFRATPTGTAGSADHFEITGVRIDRGAVPVPHVPIADSLDLVECRRFLRPLPAGSWIGVGYALDTTHAECVVQLEPPMRAAPTLAGTGGGTIYPSTAAVSSFAVSVNTAHSVGINATTSGLTAGEAVGIYAAPGSSYVLTAEI